MNPSDLNTNVVLVVQGGKELYLDPGTQFAPFGSLPWAETAVLGLRLEKKGASWVHTPLPDRAESRVERKAAFKLTSSGALEGNVTVTYSGAEALVRRLSERSADETERKQYLEEQLKTDVASGVLVELTEQPGLGKFVAAAGGRIRIEGSRLGGQGGPACSVAGRHLRCTKQAHISACSAHTSHVLPDSPSRKRMMWPLNSHPIGKCPACRRAARRISIPSGTRYPVRRKMARCTYTGNSRSTQRSWR